MKRLLLAALMLSPAAASSEGRGAGTFVHLTGRSWETLDPANAFDAVSFILVGNVYETLITFKSLGELDSFEPFLAAAVPTLDNGLLSKDGRTYAFPIRQGVRFHDGSLLTPEDVRYCILRFMLSDTEGGPAALLLRPILGLYSTRDSRGKLSIDLKAAARSVEVKGDKVVVHLKEPDNAFLKTLASLPIVTSRKWAAVHGDWDGDIKTVARINNRASKDSYLNEHMNGTGPFQLERVDHDCHAVILARHEGYWRKPAALERVVFKVEGNGGLRLFMLETGDADGGYVENSYRGALRGSKGLSVIENLPMYHLGELFFFNFRAEPKDNDNLGSGALDGKGLPPDFFSDADVRRGFAYAFDYERFFKQGLGLRGRRAAGPFPPDLLPGMGAPAFAYDPAKAEEAFKRAFGGRVWKEGFVLPVSYSADNLTRQIAGEVLKASLEKLNPKFKVRLNPLASRQFYQELEARRLPLYVAGHYADYPDPHSFAFGLLHSRGYYPTFQGFSDPQADELVTRASKTEDPAEKRALYVKLTELAAKDVPQIYTYSPQEFKVCREEVSGCDSRDNVNNLNFNNFPYFYSYSKKKPL